MESIIKIIKKNQLFIGLSDENIRNVLKEIKYYIKSYSKGEIIAQDDDVFKLASLEWVVGKELYSAGKYIVLNRLDEEMCLEASVFQQKLAHFCLCFK